MLIALLPPAGNMYSCTERCAMLVNGDVRASSFLFCWKGRKSNGAAAVTTGKERERERDKNFDKSGLTSPTCHYYDPLVRSLSLSLSLFLSLPRKTHSLCYLLVQTRRDICRVPWIPCFGSQHVPLLRDVGCSQPFDR